MRERLEPPSRHEVEQSRRRDEGAQRQLDTGELGREVDARAPHATREIRAAHDELRAPRVARLAIDAKLRAAACGPVA